VPWKPEKTLRDENIYRTQPDLPDGTFAKTRSVVPSYVVWPQEGQMTLATFFSRNLSRRGLKWAEAHSTMEFS
jgi:hypothetical protein